MNRTAGRWLTVTFSNHGERVQMVWNRPVATSHTIYNFPHHPSRSLVVGRQTCDILDNSFLQVVVLNLDRERLSLVNLQVVKQVPKRAK